MGQRFDEWRNRKAEQAQALIEENEAIEANWQAAGRKLGLAFEISESVNGVRFPMLTGTVQGFPVEVSVYGESSFVGG